MRPALSPTVPPIGHFHDVFTLPVDVANIAFQNNSAVYDLLLSAASEATLTIAADPKAPGARIAVTAGLHEQDRRSFPMSTRPKGSTS